MKERYISRLEPAGTNETSNAEVVEDEFFQLILLRHATLQYKKQLTHGRHEMFYLQPGTANGINMNWIRSSIAFNSWIEAAD